MNTALRFKLESLTTDPWGESRLAQFKYRNSQINKIFPDLIAPSLLPYGLDLASGTGVLANMLSIFYSKLICVEADQRSVELLISKYQKLECIRSKLPVIPKKILNCQMDIVTCFGAIYYLTNQEIESLCKILLSGVIKPSSKFIVNNLSYERIKIIELSGFKLNIIKSFNRPKHSLSKISWLVRQFELIKAINRNQDNENVEVYLKTTKRLFVKKIIHHPTIISVFDLLIFPFRVLVESTIVYKALFCFGSTRCDVFVFSPI